MESETFDVVKNVDSLSEDKLQDMFMAAVKIVQHLPKEGPVSTSNDTKLQFYSLYKQATKGPCTVSKPAIWNVVERFKWDAWEKLGTTDKETSKKLYIGALQRQIDETFAYFGKDYFMKQPDWPKLESVLRPAFKLINRNLTEDDESMEIISGAYDKSKENLQIVIEDDVRSNDGDYTDASEHLDLGKGQFRSTDSRPLNNDVMNALTHIVAKFDGHISLMSKQILDLTNTLIVQNNLIKKYLLNQENMVKLNDCRPKSMSWPFFLFLIVYPFIIFFLTKYWKLIKLLSSLYLPW